MFSNTANSSANDSVNTRPKLKAYFVFIRTFAKDHQREIALVLGYVLVALLSFQLGKFSVKPPARPESAAPPVSAAPAASNTTTNPLPAQTPAAAADNCDGKIKGNISSSGKIYHVPGGAFYARTAAEMCFATEAAAKAAGFRKSLR